MFQDRLKWRDGGGEGAEELLRRCAVVEFDRMGWCGGGSEEREGFCSGVVVEFGGEERVAFLEVLQDAG